MGAADLVPGVSGGTIALITGIYQQLITSLSRADTHSLSLFFKGQWKAFWEYINGSFLLVLGLGIISSALVLSHLISYLLEAFPHFVWSLFIGLALGSIVVLFREVKLGVTTAVSLLSGILLCLLVSNSLVASVEVNYLTLFLGAMIAICAMLLPGISGSFILLLLGLYEPVIGIIKNLDIVPLLVFASGAVTGLLCFSKLLKWLMEHYYSVAIAFLCGLLVGSLPSLWPWKLDYSLTSIAAIKAPQHLDSLVVSDHIIMLVLIVSAFIVVDKLANIKQGESD